jgi:glyoxylase-like metal-dependent hydrolase (beta-lactamase superfamily II)
MFQVTRLQDGIFEIPADSFVYVGDEAKGAVIRAEKAGAGTPVPVNCFLLRGSAEVILVDAGAGSAWGPGLGHARAALAAEDIPPDAVDRVILTHVHGDHALGLFEGETAYFPRARISLPATELAFFTDEAARAATAEDRRSVFDIAKKLLSVYAGRIDVVEGSDAYPGVTAVPLPGHTPGHTGYRLNTPDGEILLWGDTAHLAEVQPRDPRVGLSYDNEPEQAVRTRQAAFALAAAEGLKVSGGHLAGFFRVLADGDGFRLEAWPLPA